MNKTLIETWSICPVCAKPATAAYISRDGRVFFLIQCREHGEFETLASEHEADFSHWARFTPICVPPKTTITQGVQQKTAITQGAQPDCCCDECNDKTTRPALAECPLHCGVCDNHLMTACCVLIDVTQRCNQRCPWCFARAGDHPAPDPSPEQINKWYDRLIQLGEERRFNIQLSGGEPTVREDLPEIIKAGKDRGFEYIQLNTNGRRLSEQPGYAEELADAGLTTVFLQFDGVGDQAYKKLRGETLLKTKLSAVEACARAGLPVTLVPTIVKDVNDKQIGDMINFMLNNLNVIKGMHFQPASFFGRHPQQDGDERITMFEVMRQIEIQTNGTIKTKDLIPITTGHPLCCFCADFLREKDGHPAPLASPAEKVSGRSCCDETSEEDRLDLIRKDRDFVLKRWTVDAPANEDVSEREPQEKNSPGPAGNALSLDEALSYIKRNSFTISGMAFMDKSNLDAERLKRCRVQQFTPDGRLVPFCAWNSLYR